MQLDGHRRTGVQQGGTVVIVAGVVWVACAVRGAAVTQPKDGIGRHGIVLGRDPQIEVANHSVLRPGVLSRQQGGGPFEDLWLDADSIEGGDDAHQFRVQHRVARAVEVAHGLEVCAHLLGQAGGEPPLREGPGQGRGDQVGAGAL